MKDYYDVGVVGFWYGANYGSLLNGYATYNILKSFNKSVLMIQKPDATSDDPEISSGHNTEFLKKYYDQQDISDFYSYDTLYKLNDFCDCFCAGSDQIWNYDISFIENMFLPFVNKDKKLISFATSFGHKNDKTPNNAKHRIRKYLSRFDNISVREQFDVDILKNNYNIDSTLVFEPVFCVDKKIYTDLAKNSKFNEKEKYLLAYILDPNDKKREFIEAYAKQLNLKVINILDGVQFKREQNKILLGLPNVLENVTAEDFIKAFMNASFVISDSFHGTAFSIIFNKTFIAIGNPDRGFERFIDLLGRLNLLDRLITSLDSITIDKNFLKPIDYSKTNKIIEKESKKSLEWLKNAVNTPKDIKKLQPIIDIVKNKDCSGCGACANICPAKAITMVENDEGFLNPKIDLKKCINCGLCSNTCPSISPHYSNDNPPDCKAVIADDNIRKVSSSGGMFTIVANYVLEHKGYICGATFDKEFNVEHIIIDKKEDLDKLRGSKYYQSNTKSCYKEIKSLLDKNSLVLFTGMPCQVAGLKSYLKKEYENLITVDILCHGISSQKVFKKYLKDIHRDKKLVDLKFKAKEPWGWHAGINADFADGSHYAEPLERDPFYISYLNSISKNTICGKCKFNKLPRQGEFTLADFWGIEKYKKELNDNKGTSLVLINNKKGSTFFEKLKPTIHKFEDVPLHYAIDCNHVIEAPYILNTYRDVFFKYLNECDFRKLTYGCKNHNLYKTAIYDTLANIKSEDLIYYHLAKVVSENYNGRKIVTWIRSDHFERVLKQYFGLTVEFGLSMREEAIDGLKVKPFDGIKFKNNEYYLVSLEREYSSEIYDTLEYFGYKEFKDFVFLKHKPIILENYNLTNSPYFDNYGNSVEGFGIINKLIIPGWNNHITIGKDVVGLEQLDFNISSNTVITIGNNCIFTDKIYMQLYESMPSKVSIGNGCRFRNSVFRLIGHPRTSAIVLGNNSSFENNLECHANQGKKIFVGNYCMFSYDVNLWAGDAHTIFDVSTKKNINSDYDNLQAHKNLIVIGNHVWVCKGAFIMHGTNIGDGSIVGAMAVVKGKYPNNCSIAGNPARLIKKNICWTHEHQTNEINKCFPFNNETSDSNPSLSGKKVLVVGGTRFSGVQLVKTLILLGNDVTIATRGTHIDNFGDSVKRLVLDVSKPETCKRALSGKHYDVVFHDLAYCSNYVKNIFDYVKCDKAIQLSSVEIYAGKWCLNMKESLFDPYKTKLIWNDVDAGYVAGKQQAECAVAQKYKNLNPVIVRIPYVTKTDRLYYYCKNIIQGNTMKIDDVHRGFCFVRDSEVGYFLAWIGAQDFSGVINLSSTGCITIKDIISYIENKTKKKAIISKTEGAESPFHVYNEKSFSLNMEKATNLNYKPSTHDSWFWKLMDEYIDRAIKESNIH